MTVLQEGGPVIGKFIVHSGYRRCTCISDFMCQSCDDIVLIKEHIEKRF